MSPGGRRGAGGTGAGGGPGGGSDRRGPEGEDELARLRRLLAEGKVGKVGKRAGRPARAGRPPARRAPEAWEPGEEWDEREAFGAGEGTAGATEVVDVAPDSGDRRRWWEAETPSGPIRVQGGLVARTRRGPIGTTWWSQRFLGAIEATLEGGRTGRGRSYARQGQVMALEVRPGEIRAKVQGSRATPYKIVLTMPVVADNDWKRIVAALSARAGFAARMLAGELPHEVEQVFESEGCSMFPAPGARLVTACSCPDWANPCKHIAAVCYLVAESFDDDPFAVLAWRGRGRQELLDELRRRRTGAAAAASRADVDPSRTSTRSTPARRARRGPADPLTGRVADWWQAGPALASVRVAPLASPMPGEILQRVAVGVLEAGGREMAEVLAPAYDAIVTAAAARAGDGR